MLIQPSDANDADRQRPRFSRDGHFFEDFIGLNHALQLVLGRAIATIIVCSDPLVESPAVFELIAFSDTYTVGCHKEEEPKKRSATMYINIVCVCVTYADFVSDSFADLCSYCVRCVLIVREMRCTEDVPNRCANHVFLNVVECAKWAFNA
mgnify:CR=1 FL=1